MTDQIPDIVTEEDVIEWATKPHRLYIRRDGNSVDAVLATQALADWINWRARDAFAKLAEGGRT